MFIIKIENPGLQKWNLPICIKTGEMGGYFYSLCDGVMLWLRSDVLPSSCEVFSDFTHLFGRWQKCCGLLSVKSSRRVSHEDNQDRPETWSGTELVLFFVWIA